ncbi:MAG: MFS transporter [Acidobacteriota bacterium]
MKSARENTIDPTSAAPAAVRSSLKEVSRYQWMVLLVAWLGWVFDSMDGTLYSMVQKPAMAELVHQGETAAYSSIVFSVTLLGWAIGGVAFGVVADYIGRTRALVITILIYSLFTGLSALADTWWQLAAFRFITGLGLGGEWAAGAALVAEVWPDHLRAKAGAILQSAAAFGYFFAALINLTVGVHSWRYVFIVGAVPALFVLIIRSIVKEPQSWIEARDRRRAARAEDAHTEFQTFTLKQLFNEKHRRDTFTASILAFTVLLALWGATMWIPPAISEAARAEGASPDLQSAKASYGVMLLNGGSLFGYLLFGPLADRFGRRATFLFYFLGGVILFPTAFLMTSSVAQIFMLLPAVGFFTLGITSGFPIYLPELFPTHIRTTGVGFAYNFGRIFTAAGVLITGQLVLWFGSTAKAASAVSLVYILGIFALLFARETRGQKLEE